MQTSRLVIIVAVAITGQGTIDGQGKAFRNGEKDSRPVLIRGTATT